MAAQYRTARAQSSSNHPRMIRKLPLLFFFLSLTAGQSLPPPRLDDDTAINDLLSQKDCDGVLQLLHPQTELVAEQPLGSGR